MAVEMSSFASSSFTPSNLPNIYERSVNKTIPYVRARWGVVLLMIFIFLIRVITFGGFYVITYGLGIFLLNGFLAFLSPRFDPDLEGLSNDAILTEDQLADLPVSSGCQEEFRPFARRLPEFQFWYMAACATFISLLLSMFSFTDIPVYWPLLLIYFVILVGVTMRRQIKHMIKYKYVPFDIGKMKYKPTGK